MAKLYFRYGAMNSGKSTALMQVAHNYEEQGMKVLILKPQVDTKGGGELVSRLGVRRKADLLIPPELDVFEAVKAANAASGPLACVLCDESQFFTPEQAEQLFMVTVDLNIPVICYGLRADFSLKGFPGSTRLLELAAPLELPPPSAREQQFQALWTQFYKTLEIKARHNEKGRMTHCPKRFWADMVELQGEL